MRLSWAMPTPTLLRRAFAPFVLLAAVACGEPGTEPHTGSLVLPPVAGLPTGAAPTVTVTGPRGFRHVVPDATRPDTLDALAPGVYVVSASAVTVGGTRWSAVPDTQSVGVYDGFRVGAREITYAVSSARLELVVIGLPAAASANVTVTGPGGFARTVTATTALEPLEPGTYTITARDVQASGRTFHPGPATQTVLLGAGITTSALVDHGTGDATLAILVSGLGPLDPARITVTGPGGYARTLTDSRTLEHLEPGRYVVSAPGFAGSLRTYVAEPAAQARDVAAGSTTVVTVGYTFTDLVLGTQLVAEGLANPAFLTAPTGDARLFVVERAGRVRIVKDGVLLPTPFLDIRSRVGSAGERGMLGLAFDPQYATTGRFYVYYTDISVNLVVERFASTPGSDVAGESAGIVIGIPHGRTEHHGGTIAFGPDEMLYLAPGDGGCCGDPRDNAQDPTALLGKVLRLDVRGAATYTIPPDNPFVGRAGVRPEIWALGLRNPWRFSFDAPAGGAAMLYLADVGQDALEEVNAVPAAAAGRNYGWPITEGTDCFRPSTGCDRARLTMPVQEYSHADGCSVTGGFVYRGARIPELTGHYLYGDYCRGWVRSFRLTSGGVVNEERDWPPLATGQLLSFGRDGLGELYVISGSGRVSRIVKR